MGTGRKGGGNWEKRRWELRDKGVGTGRKGYGNCTLHWLLRINNYK